MSVSRIFDDYKEEIELALIQNACVEIELYSIIASIIRESKNPCKLSVRDVSTRKRTEISLKYYGNSGFPDFVLLEREKSYNVAKYGCIEVKMPTISLDKNDTQLNGHIQFFKKVIYTNGIRWQFYEDSNKNIKFDIVLGDMKNGQIVWKPESYWDELLEEIDTIKWY